MKFFSEDSSEKRHSGFLHALKAAKVAVKKLYNLHQRVTCFIKGFVIVTCFIMELVIHVKVHRHRRVSGLTRRCSATTKVDHITCGTHQYWMTCHKHKTSFLIILNLKVISQIILITV